MRRFPAVPQKRLGRDSDTLDWVDVFLGVETAPHKTRMTCPNAVMASLRTKSISC